MGIYKVKKYIKESICREEDGNGNYKLAVPVFKKAFVKNTKEMWNVLENPKGRTTKELRDISQSIINNLKFLIENVYEAEDYEE
jgi:hypothetical protein